MRLFAYRLGDDGQTVTHLHVEASLNNLAVVLQVGEHNLVVLSAYVLAGQAAINQNNTFYTPPRRSITEGILECWTYCYTHIGTVIGKEISLTVCGLTTRICRNITI